MDFGDDIAFPHHHRNMRPPLVQVCRSEYSSIAEGLDAKVVVMGNSGKCFTYPQRRFPIDIGFKPNKLWIS